MSRIRHRLPALLLLLSLVACNEPSQENTSAGELPAGERYNLTLDMQQFMTTVLEPVADRLWDSAGWIDDIELGYFELYPTTDEGWEAVRYSAATVVEAGNALALPSRAYDDDAWLTYAQAMSNVGLQAMAAAESQNEEDLFQAGARLYSVCTACHQAYNPDLSRFVDGAPPR
jgi:hypothetical protein